MSWHTLINGKIYASVKTPAPALTAKNGTPPHSIPAKGAYPGLPMEWAMYKYPAVAVNSPIAVELRVSKSLMRV